MASFVPAPAGDAEKNETVKQADTATDVNAVAGVFVHHCVRPRWVEDKSTKKCQGACARKFGLRVRRHHCRGCGKVFCAKCAPSKRALPALGYSEPVRCCTACAQAGDERAAAAARRLRSNGYSRTAELKRHSREVLRTL